jgi:hypothetical protein
MTEEEAYRDLLSGKGNGKVLINIYAEKLESVTGVRQS